MDVAYELLIVLIFVIGYVLITIEQYTKINKTTIALMTGVICWGLIYLGSNLSEEHVKYSLLNHLANDSQVIFFLLGALIIIETMSEHQSFRLITDHIHIQSKRIFLWVIGLIAFFLSSVIDNLTTTVVMIAFMRNFVHEREDRWIIGGAIVIAANAGGAWTPIGDVTTTMLWIGERLTTLPMMRDLFLPSLVCAVASFIPLTFLLEGKLTEAKKEENSIPYSRLIFFLGIGTLIMVPILKVLIGLPPFMGMLLGVGVIWIVTDLLHHNSECEHLFIPKIIPKIEHSAILFFLGILLAVNALEEAGILKTLALTLNEYFPQPEAIATVIGIVSAFIDNVPLVAATMGMYSLAEQPQDNIFWQMIAYCAGTGGSLLIIGSAAGVVFMGLEKVPFFWFLKKITTPAAVGYFAGIGMYLLQEWFRV